MEFEAKGCCNFTIKKRLCHLPIIDEPYLDNHTTPLIAQYFWSKTAINNRALLYYFFPQVGWHNSLTEHNNSRSLFFLDCPPIRSFPSCRSQPKMSKTQNLVAPGGMFGSALSDGAGECSGEIEFLQKEAWY